METTINERIRIVLKDLFSGNMSAMARITKIPQPSVRNMIAEKVTNPTYDKLSAIVQKCTPAISAHWLLTGEGEMLREVTQEVAPAHQPTAADLAPLANLIERLASEKQVLAVENGKLQAENKQLRTQLEQAQHSELPRQSIVRSQRAPSKKRMPI